MKEEEVLERKENDREEEGEKESVCKGDAESKGSADKRKHMATHLWAKVHEVQGKKVTTVLHSGPTRFCIEEVRRARVIKLQKFHTAG